MRSARVPGVAAALRSRILGPCILGCLLAGCPAVDGSTTGAPPMGGSAEVPTPPTAFTPSSQQPTAATTGPQGMLLDSSGRLVSVDPGIPPPPTAIRADRPLQAEAPAHEDQPGVTLEVEFKIRGLGAAPKVPEAAPSAIAKAQKLTALTSTIDLFASGRMRWLVTSRAMPIPFHAELRAKYDRYGHVLLWPALAQYRVIPSGALRAVLDEGRADVMPVVAGTATRDAPGKRLGEATRSVVLASSIGKVRLEIAAMPEASLGGPLLCRALAEMAGVDPATPECKSDEVVLAAQFDLASGGQLDLETTLLTKRTDLPPADASCPPAGASYEVAGLPDSPEGVFLGPSELEGLRSKPDAKIEPGPNAPADGLILENPLDRRVYFALDGALLALVPPQSTRYILGMPRGRYTGEWRTFFGETIEAPREIALPARLASAAAKTGADAGAAPAPNNP